MSEYEFLRDLRAVAAKNRLLQCYIGLGLLRLHHAERDPAQRARKSRLVHAVHAVSGRDRAGTPEGLLNFQTMVAI